MLEISVIEAAALSDVMSNLKFSSLDAFPKLYVADNAKDFPISTV